MSWDDPKTDDITSLSAAEYNDLVAAVKHTQAQASKWATFDTDAIYTFKVAGTECLRLSYAANVVTLQGDQTAGDDLVILANGINSYPKIVLNGAGAIDIYEQAAINLYTSATAYGQLSKSGNDLKLAASVTNGGIQLVPNGTGGIILSTGMLTTGPAFAFKYPSSVTTTGNLIVADIDAKTNVTNGTNYGVTALKLHTAAKNGSGVSVALDLSDMTSTDNTLKVIATTTSHTQIFATGNTFHALRVPDAYIQVLIGSTAYYIPAWTT